MMYSTVTFKNKILAGFVLLVFILQFIAPSRVWQMLFIGFGLMLLFGFLWAGMLRDGIRVTRERRYTWAQVGDRLEERFTITNSGFLPALWLQIEDDSTLPDYTVNQVTGLGGNATARWYTDGVCTRRGVFQLGPTRLVMGDPLGLFEVKQFYTSKVDFLIVPPILQFPELAVATHGLSGERSIHPYSYTHSPVAASVRQYQIGDSLRQIHWPTTVRRDSFFVRTLEATSSGDWWLAIDLNQTVHHGEGQNATLEKAILLASSLADRGLSENHPLGLLAQGETTIWLPPLASAGQRWNVLKTLAQASPGNLPLLDLLSRNRQKLGRHVSLIVITPATQIDWLETLWLLKQQGTVPTIILIFTAETLPALQTTHFILTQQGIKAYLIDQESIAPPVAEDAAGRWQWQITGTGKAVAIHKPQGQWEQLL